MWIHLHLARSGHLADRLRSASVGPFIRSFSLRHPMHIRLATAAALLGASSIVCSPDLAAQQRRDPTPAARAAADVQLWFGELEQLHGRLQETQGRALRDPQLATSQAELGTRIKQAMERMDPAFAQDLARMESMEAEAAAAQQARDSARLRALGGEAQRMERRFATVQARVLQQPEIAAQVATFQQKLERRMAALDPESDRLIARLRELEARIAQHAPTLLAATQQ